MKKISLFLIMILALLTFTSCNTKENSDKTNIYTSVYPVYSLTKLIVSDKCDVSLLLTPGSDSHDFNVSVSTILDVSESDLFIYLAEYMEPWASDLCDKLIDTKVLNISSKMTIDPIDNAEEHNHEHSGDEYDPHIWTSLSYMKQMVNVIFNVVSEIDHNNIEYYKVNRDNLINSINELDNKYIELFSDYEKELYFICPFQMYYFTKHYDISYESLYKTCSEEVEPSANDIINFENLIIENDIKFVISNPFMNNDLSNTLKQDTGVETIIINACETITNDDFENNKTIIDIYNSNYEILKEAILNDSSQN